MKHRIAVIPLILLAWLWARSALGQEVPLELKGDVEKVQIDKVVIVKEDVLVVKSLPFSVTAPAGGLGYVWDYPGNVTVQRRGRELKIVSAPKGQMAVSVEYSVVSLQDGAIKVETRFGSLNFAVGTPDPPPKPPDPKPPDPKPPDPKPPPAPVGFRVIIIHESADDSKLPIGQFSAMTSKRVTDYLNAKCIGGKEGWRKWDKDQNPTNESTLWQNLWRDAKPTVAVLPAVIITVNEQIMVGPEGKAFVVPATVDGMLALLMKYGN